MRLLTEIPGEQRRAVGAAALIYRGGTAAPLRSGPCESAPTPESWKGELAASPVFSSRRLSDKHLGIDFSWKKGAGKAVRAKAIVRSSFLCFLDELCKTFLLKDTMLKILRKKCLQNLGGLPFPQWVKLVGWWEKNGGPRIVTLQQKD